MRLWNQRRCARGVSLLMLFSIGFMTGCGSGGTETTIQKDDGTRKKALDFYNDGQLLERDERTVSLAIQSYSEAVRWWPQFASAYLQRGKLLARQGKALEAEADFNKAIQLDPGQPASYNTRAMFYKDQGRFPEAEQDFNRAVAAREAAGPDAARIYMNRASLYWTTGRYDEAMKDYETVLTYKPDLETQKEIRKYMGEINAERRKQNPPNEKK